jgi:hypothetical protein
MGSKKESKSIQPNTVTREREDAKRKQWVSRHRAHQVKNQKTHTPVSLKKTKTQGAKSGTVKNIRNVLATAASSRPKRNKGVNKYLSKDALVPASDVESNSSNYSRSAFIFFHQMAV